MNTSLEPHLDQQRAIGELFRGKLPHEAHAPLHRHLADCPECRRTYERHAAAERTLAPGLLLGQQRVQERLFAEARAPGKRRVWAPWILALAATAGVSSVMLMPRPNEELTARGTEVKLKAEINLRAVVFVQSAAGLVAQDAEQATLRPGAHLQLLASSFDRTRWARGWIRLSDGRLLPLGGAHPIESGADDQALVSVPLEATWPTGQVELIAVYANDRALLESPPKETSSADSTDHHIRMIRARIAQADE